LTWPADNGWQNNQGMMREAGRGQGDRSPERRPEKGFNAKTQRSEGAKVFNHEIHKPHENKRRNGSFHVAEKFTCRVNQQTLATPSSFVCFVCFVV
jgi:hypothetical protein